MLIIIGHGPPHTIDVCENSLTRTYVFRSHAAKLRLDLKQYYESTLRSASDSDDPTIVAAGVDGLNQDRAWNSPEELVLRLHRRLFEIRRDKMLSEGRRVHALSDASHSPYGASKLRLSASVNCCRCEGDNTPEPITCTGLDGSCIR